MKTFKNLLKAVRFVHENFMPENRDNIINELCKNSICKCKFNLDSEHDIILVVDKFGILN